MVHERLAHPFEPVWDENARILILGSFPSVRSRENGFYYGHPQNRFWPLLARLYGEAVPADARERRAFVLGHGVALWDSIESCRISGSSDAAIRDARPNDIAWLLQRTNITHIFCNGQQSFRIFQRFCASSCPLPAVCLPSTSPANAAWSLERLAEAWKIILD